MNSPSDTRECDARRNHLPTQEQRRKLIGGALEFAHLFPPGAERTRFLEIAGSLAFFAESALRPDEYPINQPRTARCDQPFSIVRGPDNVIDIKMPPALFGEIKQWARGENLLLSDAIRIWVKRAVNAEGIGLR
jgi:hypothetical protein